MCEREGGREGKEGRKEGRKEFGGEEEKKEERKERKGVRKEDGYGRERKEGRKEGRRCIGGGRKCVRGRKGRKEMGGREGRKRKKEKERKICERDGSHGSRSHFPPLLRARQEFLVLEYNLLKTSVCLILSVDFHLLSLSSSAASEESEMLCYLRRAGHSSDLHHRPLRFHQEINPAGKNDAFSRFAELTIGHSSGKSVRNGKHGEVNHRSKVKVLNLQLIGRPVAALHGLKATSLHHPFLLSD
ncbi:Cyclic nucleotide-gated cation channel beta-1, partial [Ophiophagus hannah]